MTFSHCVAAFFLTVAATGGLVMLVDCCRPHRRIPADVAAVDLRAHQSGFLR